MVGKFFLMKGPDGGTFEFNPKQGPSMIEVDYDEDVVVWELMLYKQCAWQHHNECLAYRHLGAAGLQGSAVPVVFGAEQLDLSGTTPAYSITPFVLFLEHIRDAVSLDALDPRRLTDPLLHEIVESGELLRRHGIIHTDANEANFLLVPAHDPTRAVTLDFAEAWTRDAAEDEEDWQGALREWRTTRMWKVVLNMKFQNAGLPIPNSIALPQFR